MAKGKARPGSSDGKDEPEKSPARPQPEFSLRKEQKEEADRGLSIVGIGASAGGLAALKPSFSTYLSAAASLSLSSSTSRQSMKATWLNCFGLMWKCRYSR